MTRLLHYSAQPFTGPVRSRARELVISMKPKGLWISVEGERDWPEWCRGEHYALRNLSNVSEIILHENAKILRLSTVLDIDLISKTYGKTYDIFRKFSDSYHHDAEPSALHWPRISEKYDGIIIAPYQHSRRFVWWYHGWDCASGCIWRRRAIAKIQFLE